MGLNELVLNRDSSVLVTLNLDTLHGDGVDGLSCNSALVVNRALGLLEQTCNADSDDDDVELKANCDDAKEENSASNECTNSDGHINCSGVEVDFPK